MKFILWYLNKYAKSRPIRRETQSPRLWWYSSSTSLSLKGFKIGKKLDSQRQTISLRSHRTWYKLVPLFHRNRRTFHSQHGWVDRSSLFGYRGDWKRKRRCRVLVALLFNFFLYDRFFGYDLIPTGIFAILLPNQIDTRGSTIPPLGLTG